MGKQGKRKSQQGAASPQSAVAIRTKEKEILGLCQKIFEYVSLDTPVLPVKLWEEHFILCELVEKIRQYQTGQSWFEKSEHLRLKNIGSFVTWFNENGGKAENIEIDDFGQQGLGLKAVNEIKAGELFVTIPRKLMMSAETARKSELGPLIKKDNILRVMQNACLVLHVHCEKLKGDSFWKPYLDILPSSYSTTLYFSADELQALKGSPAFGEALKLYRNIARQYAYLYMRLYKDSPETTGLPLKNNFTYDDHRWAVSTVITRQNRIPSTTGEPTLALIPMWDMCNHCDGTITTSYDIVEDCCRSLSVKHFQAGEQVCIFYGERSNADLLVHNGFVFDDNAYAITIQLGVSRSDPLYDMKDQLLSAMKLTATSHWYPILCGDQPFSSELIAFLRIFSMDEDELTQWLKKAGDKSTSEEMKKLGEVKTVAVREEIETKCWQFLVTRLSLLLGQYKSSDTDDSTILENPEVSEHIKLCVRLKRAERKVLQNALKYASSTRVDGTTIHQRQEDECARNTISNGIGCACQSLSQVCLDEKS